MAITPYGAAQRSFAQCALKSLIDGQFLCVALFAKHKSLVGLGRCHIHINRYDLCYRNLLFNGSGILYNLSANHLF
jgi:hypothetical protein